jgi:hypothetical protein
MRTLFVWSTTAALAFVVLLWCRGMFVKDFVRWDDAPGGGLFIESYPHHVQVYSPGWISSFMPGLNLALGFDPPPARPEHLELRWSADEYSWGVWVPHWLLVLILAPLPCWHFAMAWRRRRRRQTGLCPSCGYDLRASPDRCPECGLAMDVANPSMPASTNAKLV